MTFWSRQSIAVKLPLVFALVLFVLGSVMAIVSYLEVRNTVVGIASERLEQATTQMSTLLGNSARQRRTAMQQLMQLPAIRNLLQNRTGSAELESTVKSYLGNASQIGGVELWDASGARVFAMGAVFDHPTGDRLAAYLQELNNTTAVVGRLRPDGDGLAYPVGGRIEENGETLGYVVERRRITNPSQTQQTIALLSSLIGNGATIVVGNADGTAWSNLLERVTGVPITAGDSGRRLEYRRDGTPELFAFARPIEATPWLVAVEFPRSVVMAPADRLIRRSSLIAFTLLLIAAAIGWAFSRSITTPLARVTRAAQAAADLQHVEPIEMERHDELGSLAESFNIMTARVEQARADLEQRVAARTAELTNVNRELESFSYSVSHDLRAPLRAIAGFVQILEEDHGGSFNAEAKRSLERVKVNASRMGQLIDDLLAFAQIGRVSLHPQRVDLNHIAHTMAEEALAAAERPVKLTIEPLPPCVGEPVLLKQVFANLLSNAVKFSARAEHPQITVGALTDGETTYFVRDNGAGFDERFAEKLFGVFQRLHRTVEFEGTGVGLAIVQRIINRHGGRVWAEGKVNQGATFYFTLPAVPAADLGKQRVAARQ